jgi:hypothetical protein
MILDCFSLKGGEVHYQSSYSHSELRHRARKIITPVGLDFRKCLPRGSQLTASQSEEKSFCFSLPGFFVAEYFLRDIYQIPRYRASIPL